MDLKLILPNSCVTFLAIIWNKCHRHKNNFSVSVIRYLNNSTQQATHLDYLYAYLHLQTHSYLLVTLMVWLFFLQTAR